MHIPSYQNLTASKCYATEYIGKGCGRVGPQKTRAQMDENGIIVVFIVSAFFRDFMLFIDLRTCVC